MPNTNFQTFHQMGQAINEVVRQATGRDAVQNIDMDHVTVAQTRYFEYATASGSMVSFIDSVGGLPLEKCVVQIEPVQDLHGYDRPWVGGSGKNLANPETFSIIGSVNRADNDVYIFSPLDGAETRAILSIPFDYDTYGGKTITFSYEALATEPATIMFDGQPDSVWTSGTAFNDKRVTVTAEKTRYSYTGTITEGTTGFRILRTNTFSGSDTTTVYVTNIQIEESTVATDFAPYSNICPITGWTGVNIHVSPTTDAQDGTTYSITFPAEAGTVYSGTLNVLSGELVVDRVMVTITDFSRFSYQTTSRYTGLFATTSTIGMSNALAGNLICSAFENRNPGAYADAPYGCVTMLSSSGGTLYFWNNDGRYTGRNEMITALTAIQPQVCYFLATPLTYQLTPQEVRTLLGQNNIWADTGDIEVTHKVLKELY